MIDPIVAALLSAVAALASAVVALWRKNDQLHERNRIDKTRASQLIFALLQRIRDTRGESAPPTLSQWEEEPTTQVTELQFKEAATHAQSELNGNWEELVKRYLSNTPTPAGSWKPGVR